MSTADPKQDFLDEWVKDGYWYRDSWLASKEYVNKFAKYIKIHEMHQIVDALAYVYPAEVCRKIIKENKHPIGLLEFFMPGMMLHLWSLLFLGNDLVQLPEQWKDDHNMIAHLRRYDQFLDRRVEVGVWAGLLKNGYSVERIKETQHPTPDFKVIVNGIQVLLEIKTSKRTDLENAVYKIENSLSDRVWFFGSIKKRTLELGMGKKILVKFDGDLINGLNNSKRLKQTKKEIEKLIEPVATEIEKMLLENRSKSRQVKGVGVIRISGFKDSQSASLETNLPKIKPAKIVDKILISLRKANEQSINGLPMIAVVPVTWNIEPMEWLPWIKHEIKIKPESYGAIDAIILQIKDVDNHKFIASPIHTPWSRLHSSMVELYGLARATVDWKFS